jgi:hypothetical protein
VASRHRAVAAEDPPELAVIAHVESATKELDAAELRHIFTSRTRVWPSGVPIVRLQYEPKSPIRVEFDRVVLGMSPDESARFWIDALVRGQAQPPRVISNAVTMGKVVPLLPGAIGYVPRHMVPEGVTVLAIVRRGQVVAP